MRKPVINMFLAFYHVRNKIVNFRDTNPYWFRRKFKKGDDLTYITKVSLRLNGIDASGFNDEATMHQDNTGYVR